MEEVLKIAIPNKGRMSEKIYNLLSSAGLNFPSKDERTLQVMTRDKKHKLIFVRTADIPRFLEAGVADIGFTGFDIVTELNSDVDKIMDLDFGCCEMVVAVKEEDPYTCAADLPEHINVATSFPNIARTFLEKAGKSPKIIEVTGATEITPRLGLADVVVDITSSGSTLKSNKLKIIDKILDSSAVIVARKGLTPELSKRIDTLLTALTSVLVAREKKYLMANVPKESLDHIRNFLPGFTAPTVMTMMGDDKNVVIHVVVDSDKVFESVEKLKALGGQGILIMTVDQMVR